MEKVITKERGAELQAGILRKEIQTALKVIRKIAFEGTAVPRESADRYQLDLQLDILQLKNRKLAAFPAYLRCWSPKDAMTVHIQNYGRGWCTVGVGRMVASQMRVIDGALLRATGNKAPFMQCEYDNREEAEKVVTFWASCLPNENFTIADGPCVEGMGTKEN